MKIIPVEAEVFHADRRTDRGADRCDEAKSPFFTILRMRLNCNVMKYTTFCRGINWYCLASLKKYNEI